MIDNKEHHEWLIPTLAGMVLATLRRFRRKPDEKWRVVFGRWLAHAGTCIIAGYIASGILTYFDLPSLIAPVCAIAGLYGTMLADWVEESGFTLLTAFVKTKIDE